MQLPKIYANSINKGSIDMTLSTNPLGCSPCALKALKTLTISDLSNYPDSGKLIKMLSQKFRVKPDNIVLGNGSEQLIKLICQTLVKPGEITMVQIGSFGIFTKEDKLAGARVRFFDPLNTLVNLNTKLIFLANPSTPTGEIFNMDTLINLTKNFPKSITVIDEANGEFNNESFIGNSIKSDNVLILRTFSKALGMAGIRVGAAFGPDKLISILREAQQPFPVSSIAVKLAIIALSDRGFINKTKKFMSLERSGLTAQLRQRGFKVSDSVTNNLFVMSPEAQKIETELSKRGVSVIDGEFFPGLKTPGFRISIKDKKTNRIFLQKLDLALACIKKKELLRSREVK